MRGIDVALLYDAVKFLPLKYDFLDVSSGIFPEMKTRDILHVEGIFHDSAYCHIFVNHWPSRRGGQMASEARRLAVAAMLKQYVDSCFIHDDFSNMIIMGDFNDEPGDRSLNHILGAEDPVHAGDSLMLYNLMYPYFRKGIGTHFRVNNFREAAVLDQIIVSKAVLYGKNRIKLRDDHAKIYQNEFLLDKKNGAPLRTFQGLKYLGGFSDHLPVYTDIQIITSL
jgi:endonuclease/exonuclease/phosphatase family metal-dependent hydrolase